MQSNPRYHKRRPRDFGRGNSRAARASLEDALQAPAAGVFLDQSVDGILFGTAVAGSTGCIEQLDEIQVPAITTQLLREAILRSSAFEQSKLRTLLLRFFRYAKSTGTFPGHLPNPVDDLFVDPAPPTQRQWITLEQFRGVYEAAPPWLGRDEPTDLPDGHKPKIRSRFRFAMTSTAARARSAVNSSRLPGGSAAAH